jgi:hypothetical protein
VPSAALPELAAGWNLFGVETQEEDLDAFFAPFAQGRDDAISILQPCWFWGDQQYRTAKRLVPGMGYWGFGR